ncbi:MAG TPA: hypothetical protein VFT78_16215 [Hanamia sp.]|jgi:hypothetical protein|nr:hypothetical protein [Hanamia sp.]
MEVHHHPHVGSDSHREKKFKEYFLEFIMIFLAVTMGFFAESLREHLSNHAKEKEYIIGIKKDLVADTASMNDFLPSLISRINQTDTLIKLLQAQGVTGHGSDMYYLARLTTKLRSFIANNTTLTELEHSGNFGLITKEPVLTGLVKVQKIAETYKVITGLDEQEAEMTYPLLGNLFDASVFNTMETGSRFVIDSTATAFANITKPGGNPQLRNHNPDAINQLIFDLHERNGSFIGEVGILKELKAEEIALIQTINTQYHLKDSKPTKITN